MVPKALRSTLRGKISAAKRRLILAMACYCILALIALFVLSPVRNSQEGFLLGLVLFVFAFLALKTLIHAQDE